MRILVMVLFSLMFSQQKFASDVSGVLVEKIDVVHRDTDDGRMDFVSLLIRNNTNEVVTVFEIKVCNDKKECKREYLTGRFVPHVASWSDELREKLGGGANVTLLRIQTSEV